MQYVRSLGGSVSKTWNSINPATLSGAIDVIVVEQDDGRTVRVRFSRELSFDKAYLLVRRFMSALANFHCFDLTRKRYTARFHC